MSPVSRSARYGTAQVIAVLLLLMFAAQAAYLAVRLPLDPPEYAYLHGRLTAGWTYYRPLDAGETASLDQRVAETQASQVSPLSNHMAHALAWMGDPASSTMGGWPRVPFIVFGVLLGASLWYVSRRLYGNAGGYIALTLYAFSPSMITYAARVQPEIAAAWGAFGCIFTGIAVAHTLYAPREVVLWNWKRILLLGVAIGLGMAALFSVVVAIPMALAFMLYLVPERRRAAGVIITAAAVIGLVLLVAIYGFDFHALGMAARAMASVSAVAWLRGITWRMVGLFLLRNGPGFVLLLGVSLVTFAAWRRTRFFGNLAPLLVAAVLILVGLVLPHAAGFSFLVVALPFIFVFIAGVTSDLLQTRQAPLVLGLVMAVLLAHAYFSVGGLLRLGR